MRVLIVKTSSLGDVIHTLPAVSDAGRALPGVRFDWVVEEAFAEIPAWHPGIDRVLPVAWRRWRRRPWRAWRRGEWRAFRRGLRQVGYAKVIDAQGLLKSAWLARQARGPRCGLARDAAREPLAAWFYPEAHSIARGQHAITRVRQLFAACLGYEAPRTAPDYGLDRRRFTGPRPESPYMVFLHGTTWPTKHWPEAYWRELAGLAGGAGYRVCLPWGNEAERFRAERIARDTAGAEVLPRLDLAGMAGLVSGARAVVAVDTGLGHLSAALRVPCVTLYGATAPGLTGTLGEGQVHLCSDLACSPCLRRRCSYTGTARVTPACYAALPPARVWRAVEQTLSPGGG